MTRKSNYFPCRCKFKNDCSYRVTLTYNPALAQDPPKCPRCSGPLLLDKYRKQRRDGVTCYCPARAGRDGNMPHRKGGHHLCEHFKVPF